MASSTSTVKPPYSNNSAMYVIPISILGFIALVLVILRIHARLTRAKKLYADDWLILVAEPLSLINICLAMAAIAYGWGKPMAYVSAPDILQILKLQYAVQVTWIVTLGLVRVSVASSLLRFGQDRWWRWTLFTVIGLQAVISLTWLAFAFGQCTPLSANWEHVPNVKCWPTRYSKNFGWVTGGIYTIIDLILSLMPIKLVRSLSRPKSEKILISCLMSLGLLATAINIAKMPNRLKLGKGDPLQATMLPSLYAKSEEVIGIIACSLPCLKSPTEQLLKRMGILKEHELTRPSFVNTIDLGQFDKSVSPDRRSGSDSSGPSGKDAVRVDSVALKPGSSGSTPLDQNKDIV